MSDTHAAAAPKTQKRSRKVRLVVTMNDKINATTRARAFAEGMLAQPEYDSSSWLRTTFFNWRLRGARGFIWPWLVINCVSVIWTTLSETVLAKRETSLAEFEIVYQLVFTTMGFLLVFRLSRAAVRFWDCRQCFGNFNIGVRNLVDTALVYGEGRDPHAMDDICAWCCAFCVASKQFLRGLKTIPADQLVGILSEDDRVKVESSRHPPLFCIAMVRRAIFRAFGQDSGRDTVTETLRSESRVRELHAHCDYLILNEAALERLRATKLPAIYVIHLRSFLVVYCLSLPFVFVYRWHWGTILAVAAVSFALLGIEGAATECEIPFQADHANHLRIDQYIQGCLLSVSALLTWNDRGDGMNTFGTREGNVSCSSLDELVIDVNENV
jgi:putative membrane protein